MENPNNNTMVKKSESISQLVQAVNKVMLAVNGVEKNTTVGTGSISYKGVSDQDVKLAFKNAMAQNGLAMFIIDIDETCDIQRWEESKTHQGNTTVRQRKEVFTRVKATYLLAHTSDQWIETKGIGHGVDSQDKSIGKAQTYSLKYNLLYQFLTAVGDIDDTDKTHSEEHPIPPTNQQAQPPSEELVKDSREWKQIVDGIDKGTIKSLKQINIPVPEDLVKEIKKMIYDKLPRLSKDSDEWNTAMGYIKEGKLTDISQLSGKFKISKALGVEIQKAIDDYENQKIFDEQLEKEKKQEASSSKESENRLPNLTAEGYINAMKLNDKKEITNILNTHRMSAEQRDSLLKKLK